MINTVYWPIHLWDCSSAAGKSHRFSNKWCITANHDTSIKIWGSLHNSTSKKKTMGLQCFSTTKGTAGVVYQPALYSYSCMKSFCIFWLDHTSQVSPQRQSFSPFSQQHISLFLGNHNTFITFSLLYTNPLEFSFSFQPFIFILFYLFIFLLLVVQVDLCMFISPL